MKNNRQNYDDHIANEIANIVLPTSKDNRKQFFKEKLKENLMFEFDRRKAIKDNPTFSMRMFRFFSHALVTAILMPLLVLGSVSSYAYYSPQVYEGDVLYPIKLSIESVEYSFAKTHSEKAEKKLAFANRRLQEVEAYYDEKKDIDKKTLGKVANYTLSAVMDVKEVSDSDKKEKLESMVRDFSKEQLSVIASLEDKTKYIAFDYSSKSLSEKSKIKNESNIISSKSIGDKTEEIKGEGNDKDVIYGEVENRDTEDIDDVENIKDEKYEDDYVEDEKTEGVEKEDIKDENVDTNPNKDDKKELSSENSSSEEIFHDENVVSFENQDPHEVEKEITKDEFVLPNDAKIDDKEKREETTRSKGISSVDSSLGEASTIYTTSTPTSSSASSISSDIDKKYYDNIDYSENKIVSMSKSISQEKYHPFVSDDKGGDVEALEYIRNISNELKNFGAKESFASTEVNKKHIYNPRLYFYPSIEDYRLLDLEGYQYLIQTMNNFTFYVYPYFVDNFEVYVPKSIYDSEVEIYYTKDNSDPFSSATREIYHIGDMLNTDRNITLKFVVISQDIVSPVYTVQISIVRGEKIQNSKCKIKSQRRNN